MKTVLHTTWLACGGLLLGYSLWTITRLVVLDAHVCPTCNGLMTFHPRTYPANAHRDQIAPVREWECPKCGEILLE